MPEDDDRTYGVNLDLARQAREAVRQNKTRLAR
jgi:hypothetical protein